MTLPANIAHGTAVRWIGVPYTELSEDVLPGTIGVFLDFDGPGSSEAVVSFPGIGTFVCSTEDVEVAAINDEPTRP
ncbi:hypothetical protein CLV30_102210 [Haloactinopolyspora alba]|uniref:Uncharacterized protein n=1 Tax=Haloactinopolyspora alba TaxID=648780 RepID=A0A2P8EBH3_9ACTN|nr:hypothetical protein [Haloactinopolyspora alba]PSL06821.1 hypothetical protein CLV30_102210 [Haloactinopolyspora alba]